eukprot:9497853-Pyramimonas_sp.AAC.1
MGRPLRPTPGVPLGADLQHGHEVITSSIAATSSIAPAARMDPPRFAGAAGGDAPTSEARTDPPASLAGIE